ncbi:MAG: ABC transporter ATP-binding protein [Candidatus Eremiobacteraeota bacterium]|nr:ABC transporter ATP-binding protein [Candidatus Eremiobacteraeota bacterium]
MIEFRDVVKVHAPKSPREVRALDGVSLTIPRAAFAAVVGECGAGTPTLLTIIGALDTATSGTVLVDGALLHTGSRRRMAQLRARRFGFIFQGFDLISSLTAWENVALAMRYAGTPAHEARRRAKELLADVGLDGRMDHLPGQLSGGQQQRVAIARALANRPTIVLADEPTGELDSTTAERIISLLQAANERYGVTMIVVTHNHELAQRCDPVIRLRDGRVVG